MEILRVIKKGGLMNTFGNISLYNEMILDKLMISILQNQTFYLIR